MESTTAPWAVCTATCRERCFGLSCARKQSFFKRTKQVSHETLFTMHPLTVYIPIHIFTYNLDPPLTQQRRHVLFLTYLKSKIHILPICRKT